MAEAVQAGDGVVNELEVEAKEGEALGALVDEDAEDLRELDCNVEQDGGNVSDLTA